MQQSPATTVQGSVEIREEARAEWRRGWPLVLAGALGVSSCVIHLYSAGLFIAPIEAEMGWSRAEITSGLTILSIVGVLAAPVAGRLVDMFGARRIGLGGIILYAIGFAAIGASDSLAFWWSAWAFLGLGWAFSSPPVWTAPVAARFDRGRGLALALTLSGGGLTLILAPLLARSAIDALGWRASYAVLATLWLAVVLPVVARFFREKDRTESRPRVAPRPLRDSGCLTAEFGLILIAGLLANGVIVTMTVHFVPVLAEAGLDRAGAASIAASIGFAAIGGRLVTGALLDRWPAAPVAGAAFALPALAALLLILAPGIPVTALAAALILGLAFGAEFDIVAYLVSRRFDLGSFGILFGILTGALTLAGGAGPLIAGRIFDASGSYSGLLAGAAVAAGLASILITLAASGRRHGHGAGLLVARN